MKRQNRKSLEWPEGMRQCLTCKEIKPFDAFHKHSACFMGRNSVCIDCRKPISKRQYSSISRERVILDRAKSRATKLNIPFDLDLEDISIPKICPILDVPLTTSGRKTTPSIDRIDPTMGYVKGNIHIISNGANMLKSNFTKDEITRLYKYVTFCNDL
jgi:hypothetical protein